VATEPGPRRYAFNTRKFDGNFDFLFFGDPADRLVG
jgi:hypothetical protein